MANKKEGTETEKKEGAEKKETKFFSELVIKEMMVQKNVDRDRALAILKSPSK